MMQVPQHWFIFGFKGRRRKAKKAVAVNCSLFVEQQMA
jgi:hypothetical protein